MDKVFFQWIIGSRQGEVVLFDKLEKDDDIIYVVFKDGSRCNRNLIGKLNEKNLTGKLMAEVESCKNVWKFEEKFVGREEEKWEDNEDGEKVCVQPFIEGKKVISLIPPEQSFSTSRLDRLNEIITTGISKIEKKIEEKIEIVIETENQISSNNNCKEDKIDKPGKKDKSLDHIWVTLDKSKKFEAEVNLALNIMLPSKELYKVLRDNFDDGSEKTISYILDHIDVTDIKGSIGKAILNMYDEHE